MGIFDWLSGKKKVLRIELENNIEKGYDESGVLRQSIQNNGDIKRIKQYNENGVLILEGDEKLEKKHGLWKIYYENQKLKSESYYLNGIDEGIYKEYNESGKLTSEGSYKNGKLHGTSKGYYEDGSIYWEENYINGKRKGYWREWDKNGKLVKEVNL